MKLFSNCFLYTAKNVKLKQTINTILSILVLQKVKISSETLENNFEFTEKFYDFANDTIFMS